MPNGSLATGQRSLKDRSIEYPLRPPLTAGCPETSDEDVQYPVEVTFDYDGVPDDLFSRPPANGLERWQPLLPPLDERTALGEGNTPLVSVPTIADWAGYDGEVYVKDESRNPTWSQKDRLNRLTVSAALETGAPGIVVSSSGNHGAAAAAYGARAGLPTIVLTSPETPPEVQRFLRAYDAAVLRVPDWHARQDAVNRIAEQFDFHPVSSRTPVATGHAFGPEGYKTIAYETFLQLDRTVPGTVFVPTAHAELLYGVWKGFRELASLGVAATTPTMASVEPGARGPLKTAHEEGSEFVTVEPGETAAHSIRATQNTYRGVVTLDESDGYATAPSDDDIAAAQQGLGETGLWQEFSGAAGVAGLRAAVDSDQAVDGPVVCLATSSGFKDGEAWEAPRAGTSWESIRETLSAEYGMLSG